MPTPYAPIVLAGGRLCVGAGGKPVIANSAGEVSCLCGGVPSDCVPNSTSCPCSTVGNCASRSCTRLFTVQSAPGQTRTIYSIPYTFCCGAPSQWQITARFQYLDKCNCSGLVRRFMMEWSGSGTGPGTVHIKVYRSFSSPTQNCATFELTDEFDVPINTDFACSPRGLVDRVVDRIHVIPSYSGLFNQAANDLDIWEVHTSGSPGCPFDQVNATAYQDCSVYEAHAWSGCVLNSSNPCAGTAARSDILATVHSNCFPSGTSCGACCCGGMCFEGITSSACSAMGGQWAGANTHCVGRNCSNTSRANGACCNLITGQCIFTTELQCNAMNGQWIGEGIRCQDIPPCPAAEWACCVNAACANRTLEECDDLNGEWHAGVLCFSGLCDPPTGGACCFADGSCTQMNNLTCAAAGGYFREGIDCGTSPCVGPCCHYANPQAPCVCAEMSIQNCTQAAGCNGVGAGIFMGFGLSCGEVQCVINPEEFGGGGGGGWLPLWFDHGARGFSAPVVQVRRKRHIFGGFRGGCGGCGDNQIIIPSPGQVAAVSRTRNR